MTDKLKLLVIYSLTVTAIILITETKVKTGIIYVKKTKLKPILHKLTEVSNSINNTI